MTSAILRALRGLKAPTITGGFLLRTMAIVMAYLGLGIGVYRYALDERHADNSRWTIIDTLYFSMATMSTVGYGDMGPSSSESRAFTCCYILIGVTFVFGAIAQAATGLMLILEQALGKLSSALLRLCGIKPREQVAVDLDGDGQVDFVEPPGPVRYYVKGTVFWVIALAGLQAASVGAFLAAESEWTWKDASYHCFVTMTTVGYGDVVITSQEGRMVAFFHILISVTWLATFISKLQALYMSRTQELRRTNLLKKQLDEKLITSLDTNGDGVNKLEFVVGMLTKLELINWEDVSPFLAQFDAFDTDGSGVLTAADLALMVANKKEQIEAKKIKKSEEKQWKRQATDGVGLGGEKADATLTDVETIAQSSDGTDSAASGVVNVGAKYESSKPRGKKVSPSDEAGGQAGVMIADCSPSLGTPRQMNGGSKPDGREPAS